MSSTGRAWLVAATVGAVEALKDQGFCRWNYALRLIQQRAKTDLRSYIQAKKLSSAVTSTTKRQQQKSKQSEESLRKVMYLSCWGPNS
ncbi:Wound-responsive family protein [Perilla frutescens var. hirtella]|uniref:Wound-responsive family protein n=1 Tax=Perilla frutescens var. hirtella TaxID=608512 RepID=A0AAD4PCS5_PERFH|nr:Wound-responsive family protein [Perilla frutescens var. hirtella]KAH6835584.1 Wound-responsive family protein [Perilla frutescens var. hirtella]